MLTKHRQMSDFVLAEDFAVRRGSALFTVPNVVVTITDVALDAHPGHLAMPDGLLFADDRDDPACFRDKPSTEGVFR